MAVIAANKFIQVSGAPSGGEQAMASGSWGESATGILTNGALAFPKVAGTLDDLLSVDNSGNVIYVTRGGIDTTAFHNNVAAEISAITSKATPIGADYLLIEDSADSDNKKRILISALPSGGGGTPGGSDTQVQYNDGGAFGGMSALTYNDSTGKITANAGASATGDFEVKAQTSGTATYTDVSEKKFAIGTGTATNPLTVVSDANGVPILANAKSTSATSMFLGADYLHTTTANMADDFGTGFRFQIEDVAGVVNDIASVYARRDGADNKGKLEFLAGTDGAQVALTINSNLVIDIAQNFSQITAITDSGAVNSFERTTTHTSSIRPTFRMLSETSGNMADGFGTGMFFMIKDNTVAEVISAIYATRDGADNLGKLSFRTGLDGDVENVTINALGKTVLNASASATGDVEILRQGTGTLFKADVSANTLALFKDTADVRGLGVNTLTVNGESNTPIIEFNTDRADTDGSHIGLLTFTYDPYTNKNLGAYGVALDGSTVGNRGSKFQVFTKKDGSSSATTNFEIKESGKINMNPSFLSGANIEVGASGSGTAAFFDIVGKQWIIGSKVVRADTDLALDHSGVLTLAERSTTPTAIASYAKVYTKSDNKLYFQDGAGVEHEISFV